MTELEINKVLRHIIMECKSHDNCRDCPYRVAAGAEGSNCRLGGDKEPCDWTLPPLSSYDRMIMQRMEDGSFDSAYDFLGALAEFTTLLYYWENCRDGDTLVPRCIPNVFYDEGSTLDEFIKNVTGWKSGNDIYELAEKMNVLLIRFAGSLLGENPTAMKSFLEFCQEHKGEVTN